MNPNDQRIAIAEAIGWKVIKTEHFNIVQAPNSRDETGYCCGLHLTKKECFKVLFNEESEPIPDYLNDLNACFEMEKVLTLEQRKECEMVLADLFGAPGLTYFDLYHATAAQRCEAFLKTLSLWRE